MYTSWVCNISSILNMTLFQTFCVVRLVVVRDAVQQWRLQLNRQEKTQPHHLQMVLPGTLQHT